MYQRLLSRFRAAPEAYRILETALAADFCSKLLAAGNMRLHIDDYRSCTTLAALLAMVRPHAMDADAASPSGLNAFVAATPSSSELTAILNRISQIEARLGPRRRMGKDDGQPGEHYCTHHGWNRSHQLDQCRVLHPSSTPAKQ